MIQKLLNWITSETMTDVWISAAFPGVSALLGERQSGSCWNWGTRVAANLFPVTQMRPWEGLGCWQAPDHLLVSVLVGRGTTVICANTILHGWMDFAHQAWRTPGRLPQGSLNLLHKQQLRVLINNFTNNYQSSVHFTEKCVGNYFR